MNKLYKTYVLLRNSTKQALKDYFAALLESQSDFSMSLVPNESEHVQFIISNNEGDFNANLIAGIVNPFSAKIESNSKINASLLACMPYLFNALINIDDVDVYSGLKQHRADMLRPRVDIDESIDEQAYFDVNEAIETQYKVPLNLEVKYTTVMGLIAPDYFNALITFAEDVLTPSASIEDYLSENISYYATIDENIATPTAMLLSGEPNTFKYYISVGENYIDSETKIDSYRADKIRVVMSVDLDVRPTVHFASIIVDYFKAYIPFGELIDVNYNIEDHEAGLFEYDITVDSLDVDANVLDAQSEGVILDETIEDVLISDAEVISCDAEEFTIDMSIDDLMMSAFMYNITGSYFNAYIDIDDTFYLTPKIQTCDADGIKFNITFGEVLKSTAQLLCSSPLSFIAHFIFNDEIDILPKVVNSEAEIFKPLIDIDDITFDAQLLTASPYDFKYHIVLDNLEVKSTAVITFPETEYFSAIISFTDDISVIPHIERHTAKRIRTRTKFDDELLMSAVFSFIDVDLFNVHLIFDDTVINTKFVTERATADIFGYTDYINNVINITPHIDSCTADDIIIHSIFDDELNTDIIINTNDADMIKYDIVCDANLPTIIPVTSYSASSYSTDISANVDVDFSSYVICSDSTILFRYLMRLDDKFDVIPELYSYTSSSFAHNILIDDVNAEANLIAGEQSGLKVDISSDFDITNNYDFINAIGDIFKYGFDISQEIEYNSIVSDSTAEIFSVDNYLDLDFDFTAELKVTAVIVDLFSTYIPATFSLPFESVVNSYEANDVNFDLTSESDVISQVIDGIFSGVKYKINVELETDEEYTFIDATSESIIFESDINHNFDSEMSSSTAEIFGYVENDFTILDTFEAELYVTQSPAELFAFNFVHYSDFYSTADVYESVDLNYFVEDYNFDFDSTLNSYESVGNFGFDWNINENFDVSSVASYEPTYIDLSVIVDGEYDEYSFELYEPTYASVSIVNTIITDTFTAGLTSGVMPLIFDFNIVNTIVEDEFDAYMLVATRCDFSSVIDTEGELYVNPIFEDYLADMFNVDAKLDDEIISDFSVGGWNMYEPTDLNKTNVVIDGGITPTAYVDVIVALIDWIPAYIDVSFDMDMYASSFSLQDTDLINAHVPLGDVLKDRLRAISLNALETPYKVLFDNIPFDTHAVFGMNEELKFKTVITNVGTSDMESYFCYSTFAKLNEYNDLTYTLGSMGSSTLNELSYHKYSYN